MVKRTSKKVMKEDDPGLHAITSKLNDNAVADIIFVHGLTGKSHSTWRYGNKGTAKHYFWPEELAITLSNCNVWSLGYEADISHWFGIGMPIQYRAQNLVLKIQNKGLGKRPIIFITHSMGGLEVKEIIVRSQTKGNAYWKKLVSNISGVVFCGTPHKGSHFVKAISMFKYLGRAQKHVKQMDMSAPELDVLHDEFLTWQKKTGIPVESYVETIGVRRKRFLLRPVPLGPVVPSESGNPGIPGCDCHPVSEDHISLVKPNSYDHDVFAGCLRFINRTISSITENSICKINENKMGKQVYSAYSYNNLTPRNIIFTGRDKELLNINKAFSGSTSSTDVDFVSIYGLGGVGKSLLALEYAYRNINKYKVIWWVTAERSITIPEQLSVLEKKLDSDEVADHKLILAKLWGRLELDQPWLLIYDNAESLEKVSNYLPQKGPGKVLITSRSASWGSATTVDLGVLKRDHSIEYLGKRIKNGNKQTLNTLADVLGDLPLALEQASAYIDEHAINPDEYVRLFRDYPLDLLGQGRPTTTEKTVATVWRLSLSKLRFNKAAQELLYFFSFLSPDIIPRDLPLKCKDYLPEIIRDIADNPLAYNSAIATLRKYSLVTVTPEFISMHRLMQYVVRATLNTNDKKVWAGIAVKIINNIFPLNGTLPLLWVQCGALLPHALASVEHAEKNQSELKVAAVLLNSVGVYLWARFELDQAKNIFEKAISIDESNYGYNHLAVASSLNNLGLILWDLVDIHGAKSAHERALSIRRSKLKSDDSIVAVSQNNLGVVLWDSAANESARDLLTQSVSSIRKHHSYSIALPICMTNLGSIYSDLGDKYEAVRLYHQALLSLCEIESLDCPSKTIKLDESSEFIGELAIARAVLDPYITEDYGINEGNDSRMKGNALCDLTRIIEMYNDIVNKERSESFNLHHAKRATIIDNFGVVLTKCNLYTEANVLFNRALDIRTKYLGGDHPDVGWSLTNIGILESNYGAHEKGCGLVKKGLEIRENALGYDHPDVATNLSCLGTVLARTGEYTSAQTVLERSLSIRKPKLGNNHPATQITYRNLLLIRG